MYYVVSRIWLGGAAVALASSPATFAAAQQMPACSAAVPPGGPLAAWRAPVARTAAGDAQDLRDADLPVGKALLLTLLPQAKVSFVAPGKPGDGSHAGLLSLSITKAGTYRVALATAAWIDLLDNGKAIAASGHAHGAACSGVHKLVDFRLHPGRFIVQLSANAEPRTTMLVARIP